MSTNPSIDQTLVERLRRTKTEQRIRMGYGGMIGFADGDETREVPVNPDGPEAADRIEALLASTSAGQGEAMPAVRNLAFEMVRETYTPRTLPTPPTDVVAVREQEIIERSAKVADAHAREATLQANGLRNIGGDPARWVARAETAGRIAEQIRALPLSPATDGMVP
jgi:hypothetical protein